VPPYADLHSASFSSGILVNKYAALPILCPLVKAAGFHLSGIEIRGAFNCSTIDVAVDGMKGDDKEASR
jgi:hypothetical protein